ncbi:MAG: quinone-dependent dihydroorotate dehydrogenase [Opitutus sp.]
MAWLYEKIIRPALFKMEAEHAHELAVDALALLARFSPVCRAMARSNTLSQARLRPIEAFGLRFPNAIGLAAGFDKNACAWPAAAALGFGHVEIGTVTALAQPGNDRPRMFRYPSSAAVINRMGFNNQGSEAVAARLSKQARPGQRPIPLGINLGKSKITEIGQATADYLVSFAKLADHADYMVLNVSSPNTPGLRQLQDEDRLRELLAAVTAANRERKTGRVPLLLKIAPDLSFRQIDAVLTALFDFQLDGIIATNTTLARPGALASANQAGGLSGRPVRERSTAIINYIARATHGRLPIIGVGGIDDVRSAAEKLDAGATLLQIYTGMIFKGPFLPAELARGLRDRQRR